MEEFFILQHSVVANENSSPLELHCLLLIVLPLSILLGFYLSSFLIAKYQECFSWFHFCMHPFKLMWDIEEEFVTSSLSLGKLEEESVTCYFILWKVEEKSVTCYLILSNVQI
jgi:hypothetical protein